jgi:DNA polymerase III subunit beta
MNDEALGIGAFGAATGLPVSALRHYDQTGVLVPAQVDPATRYRSYTAEQIAAGRVVACLRALRVPQAVMAEVVASLHDPRRAHAALDAHWRAVEGRVRAARSVVERAHRLIDDAEKGRIMTSRITVPGPRLAEAIRRVAPVAKDSDDKAPALTGVLLESGPARLRLVATDRVRMVWDDVESSHSAGARIETVAPAAFLRELADDVEKHGKVVVEVDGGRISVSSGRGQVLGQEEAVADAFPAYHAFVPSGGGRRAVFDGSALADALAGRSEARYVRVGFEEDGLSLRAVDDDWSTSLVADVAGDGGRVDVGVDADLVHESVAALPSGQLVMSVDGPLLPILLRPVDRADCAVVLMPVRIA